MKRLAFLPTLLVTAALALAACGRNPAPDGAEPREEPPRTLLRVENQNFLDMTIYVVYGGGAQRRLGTVTGNSTATLRIPPDVVFGVSTLAFRAAPVGANSHPVTQTINVSPGDTVVMIIPPS